MPGLTSIIGPGSATYGRPGMGGSTRTTSRRRRRMGAPRNNYDVVGGRNPSGGRKLAPGQAQALGAGVTGAADAVAHSADGAFGGAQQAQTGTTAPATTAATPKLSAYERRRNGILDIMNDPALSEYNDSYMPNYDIARSQIENAFAQAMGEVQSRQTAGQGVLDAMPGQIDQNYGGALSAIQQSTDANAAAQKATGVASYMAPGADVAPVTAAIQGEQAGAKSNIPTLGLGLNNLVSEQRQQLGTDRGSALADISQKEEEAKAAAEQARQDRENAQKDYAQHQLMDAELQDEQDSKKKKSGRYSDYNFGADLISGQKGEAVANTLPKLTARYRAGLGPKSGQDAYDYVRQHVKGLAGMGPNKQKSELAKIMKFARQHWGANDKAISLGLYEVMGA